jgi:hypothetical protein
MQIVEKNNPKQDALSKHQKDFQRFLKQIDTLRKKIQNTQKEFDKHLQRYHTVILPKNAALEAAARRLIIKLFSIYKESKHLTKNDKEELNAFISMQIHSIASPELLLDKELAPIIAEIDGIDPEKTHAQIVRQSQEEAIEEILDEGFTIDPELEKRFRADPSTFEEILANVRAQYFERLQSSAEKEAPKTKKTQKQLEKEKREQEARELEKKGLGAIYKGLAKTLHPDLELDQEKKLEKEALMKQVTRAYEEKDLHTLLAFKMQLTETSSLHADDEMHLASYNLLLKNQVNDLKKHLSSISLDARYADLEVYYRRMQPLEDAIEEHEKEMDMKIRAYDGIMNELNQDGQKGKALKNFIKEVRQERQAKERHPMHFIEEFLDDLLFDDEM